MYVQGVWNRRVSLHARYEKVRHGGGLVSCAFLSASSIVHGGRRPILGVSIQLSEAEVHWREFSTSRKDRGPFGLRYIVSDDHECLGKARRAVFPGGVGQRCQVHLQRNATAYVPRQGQRRAVAPDVWSFFAAGSREEAERQLERVAKEHEMKAAKLAAWMREALPEGFGGYVIPPAHHRRLRRTNLHQWLNKEMKRRTRVATLFPYGVDHRDRLLDAGCKSLRSTAAAPTRGRGAPQRR